VAQVTASLQTRDRRPGRVRRTEGSARCRCLVREGTLDAVVFVRRPNASTTGRRRTAPLLHTPWTDTPPLPSARPHTTPSHDIRRFHVPLVDRLRAGGTTISQARPAQHTWALVGPRPTREGKGRSYEALDYLDTATRQDAALQPFKLTVADSCLAPVREHVTEVTLPPITPFPARMFARPVLCTAVIPHRTGRTDSHLLHCADLHLTHSRSATYRSAVLRRTTAQWNYVEMNCCTEFHPDRSRNTEMTDSERIFMKLTPDRQGCVKNSCSECHENMVGPTVAGTRSRSTCYTSTRVLHKQRPTGPTAGSTTLHNPA